MIGSSVWPHNVKFEVRRSKNARLVQSMMLAFFCGAELIIVGVFAAM